MRAAVYTRSVRGADRSWAREVGGGGLPVLPLGVSGGPRVRRVIYGNEGSIRVAMERVTKLPRHRGSRRLGPALSLFLLRIFCFRSSFPILHPRFLEIAEGGTLFLF
jgi:hypothetical protein